MDRGWRPAVGLAPWIRKMKNVRGKIDKRDKAKVEEKDAPPGFSCFAEMEPKRD